MKKALLFDIDGTLLRAKGLGTLAYKATFREVLGHDIEMEDINWLGATDGSVLRMLLRKEGYSEPRTEDLVAQLFPVYTRYFREITLQYPERLQAIPRVTELLDHLRGQAMGILTGNILDTAYIKLERAGLDAYFPHGIGGFASDSDIREELYPVAMHRMTDHYRQDFSGAIIIGDSPRDIDVARAHGIPSLIMATGSMTFEELSAFHPDYLFRDFSSWREISGILCS